MQTVSCRCYMFFGPMAFGSQSSWGEILGCWFCGGFAWLDPFSTLLPSPMTFPRWIDDPTCDSPAMLSAYLNHHLKAERGGVRVCSFTDLYMVVHRPADAPAPSIRQSGESVSMSTRPCEVPGCSRCAEGRGGYMFRWYHPAWEAAYLRGRRDGAWTPVTDGHGVP